VLGLGEEVARLEMGGGRVLLLLVPNNKSENDLVTLEVGVVEVGCFFPPFGGGTAAADGGGGVAHMLNTHKCNGRHP